MDRPRQIEDLADELLDEILTFLVGPDLLRQDTLLTSMPDAQAERNGYGERRDLDKFRLVNRRFMRIGTPRKFCRFVLRFSRDGFQRLEEFLDMRLACYVRHFTYMVRPFYQRSGWLQVLDETDREDLPVSTLRKRLDDQDELVGTDRDLALLRRALVAFSSLQQVKLLRLQDGADEQLLQYPGTQRTQRTPSHFLWEPACTRALTNLSLALLDSPCNPIRFVGPHISISPDLSTLGGLATVGTRLGGLGINISTHTLNTTSAALPAPVPAPRPDPLPFWHSTTSTLTSLHLGFDPPLTVPLPQILPSTIHLRRLHTLSLQNWTLSAADLCAFLLRHPGLRHVRLRGVLLDPASGRWVDVLSILRGMHLVGFELRGVDYVGWSGSRGFVDVSDAVGHGHGYAPAPAPVAAADDGIKVNPAQERIWEAWVVSGSGSGIGSG